MASRCVDDEKSTARVVRFSSLIALVLSRESRAESFLKRERRESARKRERENAREDKGGEDSKLFLAKSVELRSHRCSIFFSPLCF